MSIAPARRVDRTRLPRGIERPPSSPPRAARGHVAADLLRRVSDRPVLAQWGDVALIAHGTFVALGFGLGVLSALTLLQARFDASGPSLVGVAAVVIAAYAGSRLLHAAEARAAVRSGQKTIVVRGHSMYGALIGAAAASAAVYAGDPGGLLLLADCAAIGIASGYALGKLGCLMYGCCVGRPTTSRISVCYHHDECKAVSAYGLRGVPLVPLQIYEAAACLLIVFVLAPAPASQFGTGRVLGCFLVLFALARGLLLRLRYRYADERAGPRFGSVLSAGLAVLGAILVAGPWAGPAATISGGGGWYEPVLAAVVATTAGLILFAAQHLDEGEPYAEPGART